MVKISKKYYEKEQLKENITPLIKMYFKIIRNESMLWHRNRKTDTWAESLSSAALAARSVLPSNRPATPLFSPACWEPGFQAWAQSPCPELSAQGLDPLRWGCALPMDLTMPKRTQLVN